VSNTHPPLPCSSAIFFFLLLYLYWIKFFFSFVGEQTKKIIDRTRAGTFPPPASSKLDQPFPWLGRIREDDGTKECVAQACEWHNAPNPWIAGHQFHATPFRSAICSLATVWPTLWVKSHVGTRSFHQGTSPSTQF